MANNKKSVFPKKKTLIIIEVQIFWLHLQKPSSTEESNTNKLKLI